MRCSPSGRWGPESSELAWAGSRLYGPESDFPLHLGLEACVGKGRGVVQIASADVVEHGGLVAAILEVMRVGIVHSERDAVAGAEHFLAVVGDEHQLTTDDDH